MVYLLGDGPSTSASSATPQLASPADANAVISSFLAIDDFEHLRPGLDIPEQVIYSTWRGHAPGPSSEAAPLVIIADALASASYIEGTRK